MNWHKHRPRRAHTDPWEVVAEARAQRHEAIGHWIAAMRCRGAVRGMLREHLRSWKPTSPCGPPGHSVAMQAMLPLAAGYFLSYLLRNVNGTLAGDIAAELGIGADALGQLTSAYLLVFAAAQLPVGVLLDRWGPRRVQSLLLLCAAGGAALCATTSSFPGLLLGRALVGLGTAGCLVAGLKASAACFPREQLPFVNGTVIMCGGLGALAATWPVEQALRSINWHAVYGALALAVLAVAAAVLTFVPRQGEGAPASQAAPPRREVALRHVFRDARFQRFAPLSASCFGTVLAIQGLWAGPWLADVDGLSRREVATDLAWMAFALIVAAPCWAALTAWLRPRVRLADGLASAAVVLIGCEVSIAAGWSTGAGLPVLPWCGFALFGGMTVLSYSVVAEHFPPASLGRANAALNVLHIGASFLVQLLFGQVVALWAPTSGHYPAAAYQTALLLAVMAQASALAWYAWPRRQTLQEFPHESGRGVR